MSEKITKVTGNLVKTNKEKYARLDSKSWYLDRGYKSKRVEPTEARDLEKMFKERAK